MMVKLMAGGGRMTVKLRAGKRRKIKVRAHYYHHQEAKRSEGPKGRRPKAKGLCAGSQGAEVEGVRPKAKKSKAGSQRPIVRGPNVG